VPGKECAGGVGARFFWACRFRTRLGMLAWTIVAKIRQTVHFKFAENTVREPVLYRLTRLHDVVINVRRASVTEHGGFLDLQLEGEADEVRQVIEALRAWGSVDQAPT
jgi:hypothetical protein